MGIVSPTNENNSENRKSYYLICHCSSQAERRKLAIAPPSQALVRIVLYVVLPWVHANTKGKVDPVGFSPSCHFLLSDTQQIHFHSCCELSHLPTGIQ